MSFIKFLGTAGARFVMIRQLRSSAGIWLNYKSTNIIIDPGPGSLVRCAQSRPKIDPSSLDAIILTHKHLDHSGDLNVMIEAMTTGGFKKRGVLFLPSDAMGPHGVLFSYLEDSVEKITKLKKGEFKIGDINFEVPVKNIHQVQTYGLKFHIEDDIISFVSDTKYFDDLAKIYKDSTLLVVNVIFYQKRDYEHFCLQEALELDKKIKPKRTIFNHFGMSMLKQKPHLLEEKIRKELKLDIKFAYDGMSVEIPLK
ncbi:MAG: MBL fold metallo-hydrolase [Candidatus Omnitrophota bacterium]|nr:MAG: MBL fold metallo-hydrolase [Candidatus Omnitrophota bacterium]